MTMSKKEKQEFLNINNTLYKTRISAKFRNRKQYAPADPLLIRSFIPGTVLEIFVAPGQKVKQGDLIMILEAMKMKNRLKAHMDGTVKSVAVSKGDRVAKGVLLIELETDLT
jgi:biotin carboxyl carrier protein